MRGQELPRHTHTHTHYIDIYSRRRWCTGCTHLCVLISSSDKLAINAMACINIHVSGQCACEPENILAVSVPDCIAVALFSPWPIMHLTNPEGQRPIWEMNAVFFKNSTLKFTNWDSNRAVMPIPRHNFYNFQFSAWGQKEWKEKCTTQEHPNYPHLKSLLGQCCKLMYEQK